MTDDRWFDRAACRDLDPELFANRSPKQAAAAIAVCHACPVIGRCRAYVDQIEDRSDQYPRGGVGLDAAFLAMIYAGETPKQRAERRRNDRKTRRPGN